MDIQGNDMKVLEELDTDVLPEGVDERCRDDASTDTLIIS
jgi:hypothetical protein